MQKHSRYNTFLGENDYGPKYDLGNAQMLPLRCMDVRTAVGVNIKPDAYINMMLKKMQIETRS